MFTRPLRVDRAEILDDEAFGPRGRVILAELARWNRLSGWTRRHVRAVEAHWRALGAPSPVRVLDVGTGPGGLLEAIAAHFGALGVPAELVGLDLSAEYVAMAQERLGHRADVVKGDATALPFDAGSFHIGTTALMLHHLPAPARPAVIGELARVCQSVYAFDLEVTWTGALGWAGVATALGFHADTRHDGVLSVRRASTLAEFRALVEPFGLRASRVFPTALCTLPRG